MAEKEHVDNVDNADSSHDEKYAVDTERKGSLADADRRKSVALNIVENPLRVSLAIHWQLS